MTLKTCSTSKSPATVWPEPLLSTSRNSQNGSLQMSQVSLGRDTGGYCMSYLATTEDLVQFCLVSKNWKSFIDGKRGSFLWKHACVGEGIPLVEGKDRDYKKDLAFLRPITISGKTIAKYLGKVVGPIPNMRADLFLELSNSNDFFQTNKYKRTTHTVLVNPVALEIEIGPDNPIKLDEASGTLTAIPLSEQEGITPRKLIVPLSLANLTLLTRNPLAGIQNGPVFHFPMPLEVIDHFGAPPSHNQLYLMRNQSVLTNRCFPCQKAGVEQHRWEITGVRLRALYDTIKILQTGTCPDTLNPARTRNPGQFVRTSECAPPPFPPNHHAIIGDYSYGHGLDLLMTNSLARHGIAVVPGISAEVRSEAT
jgi:hypothetical protein